MKSMELVVRDDLDNTAGARTVEFSIDGEYYEIDLAEDNVDRLRDVLSEFIGGARRLQAQKPAGAEGVVNRNPVTAAKRRQLSHRLLSAADDNKVSANDVRAWAAENGIALAPRGPISSAVIDQFRAYQADHAKPKRVDLRSVRRWAAKNNIEVSAKGAIDPWIIERYLRSRSGTPVDRKDPALRAELKQLLRSVDGRAVRQWAATNGVATAPRGPISSLIIDQYKASIETDFWAKQS